MYKYKVGVTDEGKQDLRWIHNPNQSIKDLKRKFGKDLVAIPCGKCLGCQLDYAHDWAVRCTLESCLYEKNCFLTLTFNDDNCPKLVSKKDLTNFIERLRYKFPDQKIRFFGCGEHGDKYGRSHYHVILFNFDFPDKEPYNKDLCHSDILDSLWPYGFASIGDVSFASCGYVARYCMKKRSKESLYYDEFVLMSRKPGIGEQYFIDHPDMFHTDFVYGPFGSSFKTSIPRYYKKLAEKYGVDLSSFNDRALDRANNFEFMDLTKHHMSDYEELHNFNLSNMVRKAEFLKRNL